ncbi:MAG: Crp/Fnr family transcriptional regulator [Clostridia bacterium]
MQNIGEKQTEVYLLYKGLARSYYLDINGNDITKMFMKENDFCVGESLFENEPSIQGVEALEDMKTLKFDAKELKRLLLSDKYLTDLYMRYLENSLIYKMKRESSFQIMSATERYLRFQKDYKDIENRVNQSYIASYLGIAPESLSRIKRTIKEEN